MIGSILLRTSPNPYISITIYNNDKLAYNYSHFWTFNKDVRYGFVINILLFSFLILSFLILSFLILSFFFYSVFFYSVFFYLVSSCSVFSCYSFLLVLINYFDKITGFSKITILS
jgi:hypothetical protein